MDERHTSRAAAFFDLDKTIIATSSVTAFRRPLQARGVLSRRDVLRSASAQIGYLLGPADEARTERLRAQLSRTVTGWDPEQVSAIVQETLHESIDPTVYAEAIALIEEHHAAGHDVVVVSASGEELVRPIGRLIGADQVVATRMEVVDGRYTGGIERYVYGQAKADAIVELAARCGYDLAASYAYSDSITDEPMLAAVGHAFVVNPDRTLRRVADERGWGVLQFQRPVRLGAFASRRSRATVTALALAVVAVLVVRVVLAAGGARRAAPERSTSWSLVPASGRTPRRTCPDGWWGRQDAREGLSRTHN